MLTARALEAFASQLQITQLVGGLTARWTPNEEQRRIWRAGETQQRRYITKARRVGASTALDLEDVLWTLEKDTDGHRVRTAIILHVEEKAKERIKQCASFFDQLGIRCEKSALSIELANGSQIVGVTAGSQGGSRTEGYQRARWEEFAFYPTDSYGSISPSIGIGAPEVICTTIDIAASSGLLARNLWRAKNDFFKMFFPFELHAAYRADPALLSEQDWEWAKAEGFTNRSAAAYWFTEILANKCGGDVTRAMREYPQREEHMFTASEGRVVRTVPPVMEERYTLDVPGVGGDTWKASVYTAPDDTSGQLVGAIDTSQGIGESRSAVCILDKSNGKIVAAFAHAYARHDDLARVGQALQEHYRPKKLRFKGFPMRAPLLLVEKNGIGQATVTECERLGVEHEPIDATHDSIEQVITEAKRALEGGMTDVPLELAEECDELVRDARGKYLGRKDLLVTYGMCLVRRKLDGYVAPDNRADRDDRVEFQRALREYQATQNGGMKRPRWGM